MAYVEEYGGSRPAIQPPQPPPDEIDAWHRRARRRLNTPQCDAMERRKKRPKDKDNLIRALKLRDLTAVIGGRYGGPVPDDLDDPDLDYGDVYLMLAVQHRPPWAEPVEWLQDWAAEWAPTWSADHVQRIAECAAAKPRWYSGDKSADLLKVTFAERQLLHLTNIGACDMTKKQRKKLVADEKRERDRQRKALHDRANGVQSRNQYLAAAAQKNASREAAGISRSTQHRRDRKARDTSA
jgi:hypothetical protein